MWSNFRSEVSSDDCTVERPPYWRRQILKCGRSLSAYKGAVKDNLAAGDCPLYILRARGSLHPPSESFIELCLPESIEQFTPPNGWIGRLRRSAGRLQLSQKTVRHRRGHLLCEAVRLSTSTPPNLLLKGGGCTSTRNNRVNWLC